MVRRLPAALVSAVLVPLCVPLCASERAQQAGDAVSLEAAIALARDSSPSVAVARARLAEAEAQVEASGIRAGENPSLEALGGRAGEGLAIGLGVEQMFDAPGSRDARRQAARALVARARAELDAAGREAVLDAARAFIDALAFGEREAALHESHIAATEVLRAAERRFELGDVAVLDVNVARAALARVTADLAVARAGSAGARAALSAVLGRPVGALTGRLALPNPSASATPPQTPEEMPALRALAAARDEARADAALGTAAGRVRFGVAAEYEREGGAQKMLGGLRIVFPVFNKGQELRLPAEARAARLDAELDAERRRLAARIAGAAAAADARAEAARVLARDAIPQLEENDGSPAAATKPARSASRSG